MNFIKTCLQGKLFEYAPTKGTIFFTPNSFDIWEKIQKYLNYHFQKIGVQNVYFPSLFPYSMLAQEQKHVAGFNPEIFTIEQAGNKQLSTKLVLRPTSEVIFCFYFQKVLKSYRDLPILLNQWVSAWRYEQNPNPFLRNMEFLWNEGHTLHLTEKEAIDFCHRILHIYRKCLQEELLIPVFLGYKSELEKFAGAEKTWALETILPDGQFLQLATVHYFGQGFAEKFNIKFLDQKNKTQIPFQTSWGMSTRAIAALVQMHYDEKGLVLPFAFANQQIWILPIYMKNKTKTNRAIARYCDLLEKKITKMNWKVKIINTENKNFYYHCLQSEKFGIPIRLEIGEKELLNKDITFVFRHKTFEKKTLSFVSFFNMFDDIYKQINYEIYEKVIKQKIAKIEKIHDFDLYMKEPKSKIFQMWFCNEIKCETEIKKLTSTVSRILWKNLNNKGNCFKCCQKTSFEAFFGRSY